MNTTIEVMPDATAEMAVVVQQNALAPETAASLQTSFAPLFREARSVLEKSRGITVTDASQKLEIKLARECRLELRRIRTTGDKLRKELKDESLRRGRAVDGFQNILLHLTVDEEERLDAQEKFVERQEAQRKAELKASREAALAPFGLDVAFLQLGEMPDETFAQLLENTRAGHEAKLAAERKAQEGRIRAENERLKEEARIREENAKLVREAQEREAASKVERERVAKEKAESEAVLAAEREKAQAEQRRLMAERAAELERLAREQKKVDEARRVEREAYEANQRKIQQEAEAAAKAQREAAEAERKRIEAAAAEERRKAAEAAEIARRDRLAAEAKAARLAAEIKAAKDAEAARLAAEQAAAQKAAAAPDKDKLLTYAHSIRALDLPALTTPAAKSLANTIAAQREKFASWIEEKAGGL